MDERTATKTVLARNLRYLMGDRGWDQVDLAKKSGVSQKTVSNILGEIKVPTLDTVDKLASAFGLNLWHLILPTLVEDLKSPTSIRELYAAFSTSNDQGRQFILSVAEREAKFNKAS
jgi:transcriptional regulator with XRE-family HTH domain